MIHYNDEIEDVFIEPKKSKVEKILHEYYMNVEYHYTNKVKG